MSKKVASFWLVVVVMLLSTGCFVNHKQQINDTLDRLELGIVTGNQELVSEQLGPTITLMAISGGIVVSTDSYTRSELALDFVSSDVSVFQFMDRKVLVSGSTADVSGILHIEHTTTSEVLVYPGVFSLKKSAGKWEIITITLMEPDQD